MAKRSWQKTILALTLVAALFGVATVGTAHAYVHMLEHAATASDCATCHAAKAGATALSSPSASPQPAPEANDLAVQHSTAAPRECDRIAIATRAPPRA